MTTEIPLTAEQIRQRRRRFGFLMAFFFGSLLLICGISFVLIRTAFNPERREPVAVMDGVTVRTLSELPGDEAYPAALAIGPDGNIYVGSFCTGEIWQITPEGELELWLDDDHVGAAYGMTFSPDGDLYVVDRDDCDPRNSTGRIDRISFTDKSVEEVGTIDSDEVPNSITFDNDGVLYFSDTQRGEVLRLNEQGAYEMWWELPTADLPDDPRPTGLAYDPLEDDMIVADTNNGILYRVDINDDRIPGNFTILYNDKDRELDGVAVDDEGRVIFTLYDSRKVARIDKDGFLTVLAEDFRDPSDVGYLDNAIYVTNFDGVSLAPFLSLLVEPSLPFTVDVIDLPTESLDD